MLGRHGSTREWVSAACGKLTPRQLKAAAEQARTFCFSRKEKKKKTVGSGVCGAVCQSVDNGVAQSDPELARLVIRVMALHEVMDSLSLESDTVTGSRAPTQGFLCTVWLVGRPRRR